MCKCRSADICACCLPCPHGKCSDRKMPWDFWLIFLFLAVVIPWRGLRRLKQLMAKPPLAPKEKIMLYAATIAFQWLLAGVVAWRAVARGMTFAQLGLASGNYLAISLASVIGGL